MAQAEVRLTVGALAKLTGLSAPTVRLYGDAGWIPCEVDTTGRRTFPAIAVELAKRRHAERMARVGRPQQAA